MIIIPLLMASFLCLIIFFVISFRHHLILPTVQVFTLLMAIAIVMKLDALEHKVTNVQGTIQGHSEGVVE